MFNAVNVHLLCSSLFYSDVVLVFTTKNTLPVLSKVTSSRLIHTGLCAAPNVATTSIKRTEANATQVILKRSPGSQELVKLRILAAAILNQPFTLREKRVR